MLVMVAVVTRSRVPMMHHFRALGRWTTLSWNGRDDLVTWMVWRLVSLWQQMAQMTSKVRTKSPFLTDQSQPL